MRSVPSASEAGKGWMVTGRCDMFDDSLEVVGLGQLPRGKAARVVHVSDGVAGARLAAAGFTHGTQVVALGCGAGRAPVRILLRGSRIGLRPEDARRVRVRPTGEHVATGEIACPACAAAAVAAAWLIISAAPSQAGRPLATDDPGTTPSGTWALELSVDSLRSADATETSAAWALLYGVSERSDICIEMPYSRVKLADGGRDSGFGDLCFTAKWRMADREAGYPAVGVSAGVAAPGPDRDAAASETGWSADLLLAKEVGAGAVCASLGRAWTTERERLTTWGLAYEGALGARWGLAAEVTGELGGGASTSTALVGVTYTQQDGHILDFGVMLGLGSAAGERGWTAGVTRAW